MEDTLIKLLNFPKIPFVTQLRVDFEFVSQKNIYLPHSAVNISETPAVAIVEKKEYVYETKEEAKQAFKELLREKVSYCFSFLLRPIHFLSLD